jgi:cytochrome c oxidase subunit 2
MLLEQAAGLARLRDLARLRALAAAVLLLAPMASAVDAPRRIEVAAKRFSFAPAEITLKKGEPVVLVFHSADVTHGIKFKELNLATEIGKEGTNELAFTPMQTGDFVGHCSHFCGSGHGSMVLTLHVTE